jgi:Holliday junction resolvase RusA-like endonuclease
MLIVSFYVNDVPPSVNSIYKRSKYGGLFLHPRVKEFKLLIINELEKHKFEMSMSNIHVEITYYVKKSNIDIDNLNKVLLDSMNNIVYGDDKQIFELNVKKCLSDHKRTVITVNEIV